MKKHKIPSRQASLMCSSLGALVLLSLCLLPSISLAADASLCAEVKIEIRQEMTLEQQAFDARMRINNGIANIALEKINVDVTFTDKDGTPGQDIRGQLSALDG
jgi:hypothetical protein